MAVAETVSICFENPNLHLTKAEKCFIIYT